MRGINTLQDNCNSLTSVGMLSVIIAQFLSALADNALLFAAIALLQARGAPDWQIPLLQMAFVIAFIVLAPFAGPFADAWPKGRVMLVANGIKLAGTVFMLLGINPLFAYSLVGFGAAAYSPAKYGILSELVGMGKLVRANGIMEGSTIVAILLGTVAGGKLTGYSANISLLSICICYTLAALANFLIPRLPVAHELAQRSVLRIVQDFCKGLSALFHDRDARFSLIGTSIFWGAGSTLRLLLVAWVPVALGVAELGVAANLSGTVAFGIALGATGAAVMVSLDKVNRALPAGLLIGIFIVMFAQSTSIYLAAALLVMIGACGGFYVVPLNALLQERGHDSVGSGHAVAVQNFFENFAMLLMLGLYTLIDKSGMPVIRSATLFGSLVFVAICGLAWYRLREKKI